jgi:hypothetical protein
VQRWPTHGSATRIPSLMLSALPGPTRSTIPTIGE